MISKNEKSENYENDILIKLMSLIKNIGFEDALADKISRNNQSIQRSSVISTDRSNLVKKTKAKTHYENFDNFFIKWFLNVRDYSKKVDSDDENIVYFSNDKSIIRINTNFDCRCNGYKFDEYFEDPEVMSKGCFPTKSSGISYLDFNNLNDRHNYYYFRNPNYNGSEYFRQTFLYENKLATISLIVKKVAEHPGWCCTYPEFSISIVVKYYDLDNNISLKGFKTDVMLEFMSLTGSFLSLNETPNSADIISVVSSVCDEYEHFDSEFVSKRIEEYQEPIQKGFANAYRKVEKYLGVNLEKKEKLGTVKKLILSRNTENK